jgi:hypothetical protein
MLPLRNSLAALILTLGVGGLAPAGDHNKMPDKRHEPDRRDTRDTRDTRDRHDHDDRRAATVDDRGRTGVDTRGRANVDDRGRANGDERERGFRRYAERPHDFYVRYGREHARSFSHGHFYPGRFHRHWAWSFFHPRFRTTVYYDPFFDAYFYWSADQNAFFPISFIDQAPPTDDLGPLDD